MQNTIEFDCFCYFLNQISDRSVASSYSLDCKYFVNACGPHAAGVARMAGIGSPAHSADPVMQVELPVRPRKRMVFVISCPNGPKDMPMMIDPSGFYVRKESQKSTYICGISPNKVIH